MECKKSTKSFDFFQNSLNLFKTYQNILLSVFYMFLTFLKILVAVERRKNVDMGLYF